MADGADVQPSETLDDTQTTDTTDQTTPSPTTDVQSTQEEEFDQARAKALISKLREESRQREKAHKAAQSELESFRQAQKAAEDAKLSEQQRLEKTLREREAELEQERLITRDRMNRYEVQLVASQLGIVDPDAAVKLLDWSSLEYAEDGTPKDVEAALKQLAEDKPYLVRQATTEPQAPRQPANPTNPATRTPATGHRVYTSAEIADRAFYVANRDDITRALREGRLRD